ncbi:MAG: YkgJ family cysteine cluster protein [Pseudomonadota bacterium]
MRKGRMKKAGCSCEKCSELCKNEPGWFLHEEIEQVARFLGISKDEFVEKYCETHQLGNALPLSPKRKQKKKECIFFENGLCKIHEVKPFECKKVFGCEAQRKHKRIREIIAKSWE